MASTFDRELPVIRISMPRPTHSTPLASQRAKLQSVEDDAQKALSAYQEAEMQLHHHARLTLTDESIVPVRLSAPRRKPAESTSIKLNSHGSRDHPCHSTSIARTASEQLLPLENVTRHPPMNSLFARRNSPALSYLFNQRLIDAMFAGRTAWDAGDSVEGKSIWD